LKAREVSQTATPLPPAPNGVSPASWVEKTPGVCGGEARIRATRITVAGLVERRSHGLSDAEILGRLPDLGQADLNAAWDYYALHREEIDQAIHDNAEP
jgi:uncharacterized protein (DUF433 family)